MAFAPAHCMTSSSGESSSERLARQVRVANAVLDYLAQHPNAVDSPGGIRQWWVKTEDVTDEELVEVLHRLLGEKRIARRVLPDGQEVFLLKP